MENQTSMNTTDTTSDKDSNQVIPSTAESIPNRKYRREGLLRARQIQKYARKGYTARKIAYMVGFININEGEQIVNNYLNL